MWPPEKTAAALESWAESLEGRIIPAAKIHLTLAFLGVVDATKALQEAIKIRGKPHELPIETAKYWKHNRIVWVGPRETPLALKALVEPLHAGLERAGFVLERRPFAAHVTLARNAPVPKELLPLPAIEWPVREFTLVRSNLSPKGSDYEIAGRFPLRT